MKKRALPRRERNYPQSPRVVSTNFPAGFVAVGDKCYVPLADYRKLERKYYHLFSRYQRARSK